MADNITLRCPNLRCRSILSVPDEKRGECVRCGVCGVTLRVPSRPKTAGRGKPVAVKQS